MRYKIVFQSETDGEQIGSIKTYSPFKYNAYFEQPVFYKKYFNKEENKERIIIISIADLEKSKSIFTRGLEVHHEYYQDNKMPWEYPDSALKSLCWICHEKIHCNSLIKRLDIYGNEIASLTRCSKCFGAGYIPIYNHVQNGICFQCWGARFVELIGI